MKIGDRVQVTDPTSYAYKWNGTVEETNRIIYDVGGPFLTFGIRFTNFVALRHFKPNNLSLIKKTKIQFPQWF